jgi:hypothetical protein
VRTIKSILASEQQKEVGPALSEPIGDYINRINPAAIESCCGFHWNNKYLLAVPLDNSTTPNYVFPFNTNTNSWSGFWTQWKPLCFSTRVDAGISKLWFGQSNGTVAEWMDYVPISQETDLAYKDQGTDIPCALITRGFIQGDPISPKTGFTAKMEFNGSVAPTLDGTVLLNNGAPQRWETFSTVGTSSLTLPFTLPATLPSPELVNKAFDLQRYGQWNHLQIKLTSSAKKVVLSSLAVSAFIDSFEVQTP